MSFVLLLSSLALAEPPELPEHMQGHFAASTDAAWFIADGNLEEAHRMAAQLDHDAPATVKKKLIPLSEEMRRTAGQLAKTDNLGAASLKAGELAQRCAACHSAAGKGPSVEAGQLDTLPTEDPKQRHIWGFYAMWSGVVASSDYAWSRGTELLEIDTSGLTPEQKWAADAVMPMWTSAATEAAKAEIGERPASLSSVLLSCSTCHAAIGVSVGE